MNKLRYLPAVHQLIQDRRFLQIATNFEVSKNVLTKWLNEQVDLVRNKMMNDELLIETVNRERLTDLIFNELEKKIERFNKNNLRSVINATGVILHTNLGRARISKQAIKQISETASTYSTLEFNLGTGQRGSRHHLVEEYITQLTGAEAAIVVNNNAAAVYLVLKAIGSGGEVIVSRGELVEIGGSFRISEIMKESDAQLVDVGTTNKTHISDYTQAITDQTTLLMKVHKSNFKLIGFTEEVDTDELIHVSKEHNIPIYEDLGSGTLFNFTEQNIGTEPTVQEKINTGIDILSFSGDKLLGGPQAGIIVGKKQYIEKLKKHPLARVLRVDKFTLAGLEATLKSYIKGQERSEIPTIRDLLEQSETILKKANNFVEKMNAEQTSFRCKVESDTSKVGGGTMPDVEIDTFVVNVKHPSYTSAELAARLRNYYIPIIVRVKNDAVLVDFRTVQSEEVNIVIEAFLHIEEE
ncbi:L-seryl-tRNA(Sec) selenium transferase [Pueribacillus sp. YX66]|uniref:L-seryl-tRNA(Sec) selenium transferase n=1 Tax=Pueribacillus sp. YX66 TaxID=3229242 RepID=UPI00358D540D